MRHNKRVRESAHRPPGCGHWICSRGICAITSEEQAMIDRVIAELERESITDEGRAIVWEFFGLTRKRESGDV